MKKLNVLLLVATLFSLTLASCGCLECDGGYYDGDVECSKSRIVRDSFKSTCKSNGGSVK